MSALDMDSITKEFEVINPARSIEDADEEGHGTDPWSVQQSMRMEHPDSDRSNSPVSLQKNASLASIEASEQVVNDTIAKEVPFLEGSTPDETLHDFIPSIQPEAQTTVSQSSTNSDYDEVKYNERTGEVLKCSHLFFDEMEKTLNAQKKIIILNELNAREYKNRILQLENQLRADSEEREFLKERVDGHEKSLTRLSAEWLYDTNSLKLENEKLSAQLAEKVAKEAQERELLKLAESRLAEDCCRQTDYIRKLEQELSEQKELIISQSNTKENANRIFQLENQLHDESEERKNLKERVEDHENTLARLRSECESWKSEKEKLRAQLDEEMSKGAQEREFLKLAESHLAEYRLRKVGEIALLERELENARKCLKEAEKQNIILVEENENKNAQLAEKVAKEAQERELLKLAESRLAEDCCRQTDYIRKLEQELSEQKELIISQSNTKENANRIFQLENQLHDESEERKNLKERVEDHENTLARLRSECESWKSEKEKLRAQLDEEMSKGAQEREFLKLAESHLAEYRLRKVGEIALLERELENARKCLKEAEKQNIILVEENENKKEIIGLVCEDQAEALRLWGDE